MTFTLVSGDVTLVWEDGTVSDQDVFAWMVVNPRFQYHGEGGGMDSTLDMDDPLGCYMTLRYYLGQKTGKPVEPGDELAEFLELESRDTGEDE